MGLFAKLKSYLSQKYYPWRIKHIAACCRDNLYVGGKSYVTSSIFLGHHVSFNGMEI